MATFIEKLPQRLVFFRFFLGPAMLVAYYLSCHPFCYFFILSMGFVSDVFDGIIARKVGVSTDKLRSMDSWADTTFYSCVFLVAIIEYHETISQYWIAITVLVGLELVRHIFDHIKFGKSASYHMWSAKLWGVCLYLGFLQLLVFGEAGYFFLAAIAIGIVTDIEGLLASVLLSEWQADVPSIFHAVKIKSNR